MGNGMRIECGRHAVLRQPFRESRSVQRISAMRIDAAHQQRRAYSLRKGTKTRVIRHAQSHQGPRPAEFAREHHPACRQEHGPRAGQNPFHPTRKAGWQGRRQARKCRKIRQMKRTWLIHGRSLKARNASRSLSCAACGGRGRKTGNGIGRQCGNASFGEPVRKPRARLGAAGVECRHQIHPRNVSATGRARAPVSCFLEETRMRAPRSR